MDYSDSTLVISERRQNTVSSQYARQFAGRERGGAPHPGAKAPTTHGNLRMREPVHRDTKQDDPRSMEQSSGQNVHTIGGATDLYCRSLPRPGRGSKSRLWSGHGTLGRESRPQNSIMGFFQRRQGLDQEAHGRKAVQVKCTTSFNFTWLLFLLRIWSSASRAEPWKSTGPRKGFNNLRNRISQIVRVVTARPMCGVIEPMRLIWKRESVVGLLWLHQTHGGRKSRSHPHLPHQLLREC